MQVERTGSTKMIWECILTTEPVSLTIECVFMQKYGEPLDKVGISQ